MRTKKLPSWAGYILFPLIFVIITVAILFALFAPTINPYIGLLSYVISDKEAYVSTELFTGISEDIAKSGMLPRSQINYPQTGDMYGNITVSDTSVDAPLYYGDATKQLNSGVGTYVGDMGAGIPGESKTVLLAGHNNTFFNGLQDVQEGATVTINTNYGQYIYEVTGTTITSDNDASAYDLAQTNENLIMYTCYPFDALGLTPVRFFVYAKYVSGPVIDPAS
ncbi:MAG: class D sortase [Ruminococcaceae bacterium]|nr:class D sortase [Oscillospiraceae bacterium]